MVEVLECPICNGKDLNTIASAKDYTVSHETFTVKQCLACNLAITTPRPENEVLGKYYQSEEYISHSGKSSGILGSIYRMARSFSLTWKKSQISMHAEKGTILDFGCGTGEFLQTLQHASWEIEGVEPSDLARSKATQLSGKKIHTSLQEIKNQQFTAITAWHVLEHVPDLHQTLLALKSMLAKNGTIFIAVPNYQSPDSKVYNAYWAGLDVPRHVWHFSKESMKKLLENAGLKLIKIVPMKLDAYYVSMLSEKYKNNNRLGVLELIRGFVTGLTSNLKARKTVNHSSLIYIAKLHEG